MKKLALTEIGFFNPGRLSDEEVEMTFIARKPIFEYLIKNIALQSIGKIPQHYLIIGQRGMGKTSLLMRVAVELRKTKFSKDFIPISFPEEQYNIDRLSKFWLNCLDSLADALDREGDNKKVDQLDKEIAQLGKVSSGKPEAYEAFLRWQNLLKRRPVLMVDNLNLIFDKISKEEQHQLRAILIKKSAPILLGASATSIDQVTNYDAPFYDAFHTEYLKKLTLEESFEVLSRLAILTQKDGFDLNLSQHKGRVATLYQLTGGTPRTLAMLFPLIADGFHEQIQTDLDALLDIITPLYKARFEELSAQLQIILDAIALHWDPMSIEQLRDVTKLENAKLSPQLKRLVDVGWIRKLKPFDTKGKLYEISERFFNVWYLMRRSSRRQKRELYCLSKFLETFYGDAVDDIAQYRLEKDHEKLSQLSYDLALSSITQDKEIGKRLMDKTYNSILEKSFKDSGILKNFQIPKQAINKKITELFGEAESLFSEAKYDEALVILQKAVSINSENSFPFLFMGLTYQGSGEYEKAEKSYSKAIELDSNFAFAHHNLGALYQFYLNRYEDAENCYLRAIAIEPKQVKSLKGLGDLYQKQLRRYEDSEKCYLKAIEIDELDTDALIGLGDLYQNYLNRYEDAEKYFLKATKVDSKDYFSFVCLGYLYHIHLMRFEDAEKCYLEAIKLDSKVANAPFLLGGLYQDHLGRYEDAEKCYLKVIEIDELETDALVSLGDLYQDFLNKYEDAEKCYLKAIEIAPTYTDPLINLGNLYQDFLNKYEDAEIYFLKAIEIDSNDTSALIFLGDLYQNYLERYEDAEKCYLEVIEIDSNDTSALNSLGKLYYLHFNRFEDSEKCFLRVLEIESDNIFAHSMLGVLYYGHLQRYQDSEKHFLEAINLNPKFVPGIKLLGDLYRTELNKYVEAEKLYLKTIKVDTKNANAFVSLGDLYKDHLNRFEEAEKLYLNALKLTSDDYGIWNKLGNLYQDYLGQFDLAKDAYSESLKIAPDSLSPLYNLIFLYRDKLNNLPRAIELFNKIDKSDKSIQDSKLLNDSLFALYDKNAGLAQESLRSALEIIPDGFKENTKDDWYRAAAVFVKQGFGELLLETLHSEGFHIILRPYYEAIKGLMSSKADLYFNTVAAEVRGPAKEIMQWMQRYNK